MQGSTGPDWDFWCAMPRAQVWQVVALSMDIEPEQVPWNPHGWMGAESPHIDDERFRIRRLGDPGIFRKRVKLLVASLFNRDLFTPGALVIGTPHRADVGMAEFARWALSTPYFNPLPERLQSLGAAPAVPKIQTAEERQDRRLLACEAAGLDMPKHPKGRMPDGIAAVAAAEGITRQSFTDDVRKALGRRYPNARS